jgi:hypothetical protein
VVSHVAEMVGSDDRVGELFEGVGVNLLDGLDQVVEPGWVRHTGWICHGSTIG